MVSALKQRAGFLSDMEKNLEGFNQSVKYILGQSNFGRIKGIYGTVSSNMRYISSPGSPTDNPPIAYPGRSKETTSLAL